MKFIYINLVALFSFLGLLLVSNLGYFSAINFEVSILSRWNVLDFPFFLLTEVGGIIFITFGSLALITFLVVENNYRQAIFFSIALFGGLVSQTIIKNTLLIERPINSLISSFGYSFPSGHTNMVTILFLGLCIYVFANLKNRRLLYTLSFLIVVLVGISRVYLNVHWVTDVFAGWFMGIFWVTLPLAVERINLKQAVKRLRFRSSEELQEFKS